MKHVSKNVSASRYDTIARNALPHIRAAAKHGAKCARHFTVFLNAAEIHAPNGTAWNESAYLKARRHLQKLGLDSGPLDFQAARDNCFGHDARRAALLKKLHDDGKAYGEVIAVPMMKLVMKGLV
jgi:hypothetical protein